MTMTTKYRVLVSGSRDWTNKEIIRSALSSLEIPTDAEPELIHGNCQGVDLLADSVAREMKWQINSYPAEWNKYGKAAGPLRNKQMITDNQPQVILCFRQNNSKGTTDMIGHAKHYAQQLTSKLQLFVVYDCLDNVITKNIIVDKVGCLF